MYHPQCPQDPRTADFLLTDTLARSTAEPGDGAVTLTTNTADRADVRGQRWQRFVGEMAVLFVFGVIAVLCAVMLREPTTAMVLGPCVVFLMLLLLPLRAFRRVRAAWQAVQWARAGEKP